MLRTVVIAVTCLLLVNGAITTTNKPARATSNTMSSIGRAQVTILGAATAQALKPAICAAITPTTVVRGSGTFSGTGGAELILGSVGSDTITGGGGDDCILGGGGDDTLNGSASADVCDGGPGSDLFSNCATTYN